MNANVAAVSTSGLLVAGVFEAPGIGRVPGRRHGAGQDDPDPRADAAATASEARSARCCWSVRPRWWATGSKEAARFTPDLRVLVHHGAGRKRGRSSGRQAARTCDGGLQLRLLLPRRGGAHAGWSGRGVILDEAQNIKNAGTKQAQAARGLQGGYRIALTGTPVENNVGDLWSSDGVSEPGLSGNARGVSKRNFFVPIQVYCGPRGVGAPEGAHRPVHPAAREDRQERDHRDLPEKLEMKVYCNLTPRNRRRCTRPW